MSKNFDINQIILCNEKYLKNQCDVIKEAYKYFNDSPHSILNKMKENIIYINNNHITKEFNNILHNTISDDIFEIVKKSKNNLIDLIIESHKFLGSYGWGFYYIDEIDNNVKDLSFIQFLKNFINENPNFEPIDLDKYISSYITINDLFMIVNKTKIWLDPNDEKKLDMAYNHYNNKRFYDCASILFGLIDAQNIKQELLDLKNGNYKYNVDTINSNGKEIVKQGWDAYSIIFRNNFSEYFNNKLLKKNLEKITNDTKYDMNIIIGCEILCVSFPLLTFFNSNNWKNYPQKPDIINRNWLMHGMYSYDDITEYDCIKLFLMLYQLSHLYDKLNTGNLE